MTDTTTSAAHAMTPTAARTTWHDLPEPVRTAIEHHAGVVRRIDTINSGLNASFTARLHTDTGTIFAKAVPSSRAAAQRREAQINHYVQPIAPQLLWHIETHGWHVLGFEHLDGRTANLTPGSTDLPDIAAVLAQLIGLEAPHDECKRIENRWADAAQQSGANAELLAGNHLLHTDLNPHNILVTDTQIRIVDWSWPTLGAAWIDTACTALWLIPEGHTPADAETWASQVPAWADATPEALNAFTTINATLWEQIATAEPRPWKQRLHNAATTWARYRTTTPKQ
jgi:hypothetical protein